MHCGVFVYDYIELGCLSISPDSQDYAKMI